MSETPASELPFIAPCRELSPGTPLRWLALGWKDLCAAPAPSLAFGAAIVLLSVLITAIALGLGTGWMLLVLLSGFVFVAPVLGIAFYTISAQLARGVRPTIAGVATAGRRHLADSLVYSLILMVLCLLWVRAGSAVQILFPDQVPPKRADLVIFFAVGSAIGSLFALAAFAASAFSLPMLVDRRADAVTAVVTSIHATLRNRRAMAVWALLVVLAVALGFATGLVGLAVTMPVIGHATWHAYREAIDASAWPAQD
jgi:uncharacterized membrane protein